MSTYGLCMLRRSFEAQILLLTGKVDALTEMAGKLDLQGNAAGPVLKKIADDIETARLKIEEKFVCAVEALEDKA